MKKTLICIALAGLALATRPTVAAAGSVDTCKMISFANAAKAVGRPIVRTERSHLVSMSCTYKSAAFSMLVFTVQPFLSPAQAKTQYRATITNSATQASPSMKLSGIGDDAQRLGPMIYVLKNSSIYVFSLISPDTNGAGALRVISLAKSVVGKL